MPGYRTHLIAGTLVFAGCASLVSSSMRPEDKTIKLWALFLGATLLGALFPDIDVPSKMQRLFYITVCGVLIGALILKLYTLFMGTGAGAIAVAFLRHRTITHRVWFMTLLACGLMGAGLFFFPATGRLWAIASLFFMIGAWSHLLLDRFGSV